HVRRDGNRLPAQCPTLFRNPPQRLRPPRRDCDARALPRESKRRRPSDTARCAGDNDDLPLQRSPVAPHRPFLLLSPAYPVAATHTLPAGCAPGAILFRCWPREPRGSRRLIGRNSVSRYELLPSPAETGWEGKGTKGKERE